MSVPLSMRETAAETGLSYERWRKVWRAWSKARAFPAPIVGADPGDRCAYAWDRDAVAAWKAGRSTALMLRADAGEPANDDGPRHPVQVPSPGRIARQRQDLARRMGAMS